MNKEITKEITKVSHHFFADENDAQAQLSAQADTQQVLTIANLPPLTVGQCMLVEEQLVSMLFLDPSNDALTALLAQLRSIKGQVAQHEYTVLRQTQPVAAKANHVSWAKRFKQARKKKVTFGNDDGGANAVYRAALYASKN